MASSFLGLYVQRDALLTAQKSLDIVGNNIANVDVNGYTRQRVDVCSVARGKGNLLYNTSVSLAGQGVNAVGVAQIRDALLDKKLRNYTSDFTNVGVKVKVLSDVESALDNIESKDAGFNAVLSKFKASLQGFSADNANRNELASNAQSSAKSVVGYFNMHSERLDDISDQVLNDTKSVVKRVNAILAEMGDLNKQITDSYINMNNISMTSNGYQVDGQYGPLELKDEMNRLLDELSEYANIDFTEEPNGSFTVKMAGQTVVDNKNYAQMAMSNKEPFIDPTDTALPGYNANNDPTNPASSVYDPNYDVNAAYMAHCSNPSPMNMEFVVSSTLMDTANWKAVANSPELRQDYVINNSNVIISDPNTAGNIPLSSGALRGYMDVYNGNGDFTSGNNTYNGIPYYKSLINSMAKTFADEFNAIFEADFGFKLFDYDNFDNAAETLRLNQEWINNPILISKPYLSASYQAANPGASDSNIELDNTYIMKMLGVFEKAHSYGDGTYTVPDPYTFEKFAAHINDTLGGQVEYETGVKKTSDIMLQSIETQRFEKMGVSLEEEAISMMNYQKWYNAIARMTTTLDEALDKLINGTGRVGL